MSLILNVHLKKQVQRFSLFLLEKTEEDIKKSVDELEEAIHNAQIMMLPGGFSAGDALVKLGLLPHGHIKDMSKDDPTLTFNTIDATYLRW